MSHSLYRRRRSPGIFFWSRRFVVGLGIVATLVGTGIVGRLPVAAQSPTASVSPARCVTGNRQVYSASLQVESEAYDVYVKLGKPDLTDTVTLYHQEREQTCGAIGNGKVTGERWTRIGVWLPLVQQSSGTFSLETSTVDDHLSVSRPQVMLLPRSSPACVPDDACEVIVDGQRGMVQPAAITGAYDQLAIVRVRLPNQDAIQSVDYYVDDRPVYSRRNLEAFNTRFVGAGRHTLLRVANYESGQRVVFREQLDRGWANELPYMLFSILYGSMSWLQLTAWFVVGVTVLWLGIVGVHILYKRHLWKAHHFMKTTMQRRPPELLVPGPTPLHYTRPDGALLVMMKLMVPFLLVLCCATLGVVVSSSYVFQVASVDGPSMERTLHNGQNVVVNKLGVTLGRINHTPYLPHRGHVVMLRVPSGAVPPTNTVVMRRVIGLPGERIRIEDGIVTIYNDNYPEGFNPDAGADWTGNFVTDPARDIDVVVPAGELFVCGDNRPESIDSRTYGSIPLLAVQGQVMLRLAPFGPL